MGLARLRVLDVVTIVFDFFDHIGGLHLLLELLGQVFLQVAKVTAETSRGLINVVEELVPPYDRTCRFIGLHGEARLEVADDLTVLVFFAEVFPLVWCLLDLDVECAKDAVALARAAVGPHALLAYDGHAIRLITLEFLGVSVFIWRVAFFAVVRLLSLDRSVSARWIVPHLFLF